MWKYIISSMNLNVVQQHKLVSAIHTINNTVYLDPFLGDNIKIKDKRKTTDESNDWNATKHRKKRINTMRGNKKK